MSFKSEHVKGDCPMFLCGDPKESPKGLIVLQEWWGLNREIKQKAEQLAKQGGFTVLVPDLYRGKVTEDYEEAGHMMDTLDWSGAVKDIQGAARYLLEQGCQKVGVTGFCMGGALSLAAAALVPEITASAPFYGIPKPDLADMSTVKIPVQAHFAENDTFKGFSSPEDAQILKQRMAGNPGFQLFMYPNCGHAFMDTTGPRYNKEMSILAQKRLVEFMNSSL